MILALRRMAGALALAVSASGCGPYFQAVTTPPPSRSAKLDREHDSLEISRGVALAFECRDGNYSPCEKATVESEDPKVALVYRAHMDDVSESWYRGGPNPRSSFVVVGVAPGKTRLKVTYADGDTGALSVTVLDDPAAAKSVAR